MPRPTDTTGEPWLLTKEQVCEMLDIEPQTFANSHRELIPDAFVVRVGQEVRFRGSGLAAVLLSIRMQQEGFFSEEAVEAHRRAGAAIGAAELAAEREAGRR